MPTTPCRWCLVAAVSSLTLAPAAISQATPAIQRPTMPAAAVQQGSQVWASLTPEQQATLAPLQQEWDAMEPSRRSKWLEVARRFPRFSADEQQRMQRRMGRWADMTAQERSRARVQFQRTREISAQERRAGWDAYQLLSAQEQHELAQRAVSRIYRGASSGKGVTSESTGGTALKIARSLKPVGPTLVQATPGVSTVSISSLPATPVHQHADSSNIAETHLPIDRITLLPQAQQAALASQPPPPREASDP